MVKGKRKRLLKSSIIIGISMSTAIFVPRAILGSLGVTLVFVSIVSGLIIELISNTIELTSEDRDEAEETNRSNMQNTVFKTGK